MFFLIYTAVCLLAFNLNANESLNIKPKLSIITSLYNGDDFIEGFFKDITSQTIFSECELIIINANSPGNEEPIIKQYQEKYPNIFYIRLDEDPGLYACWNLAIKMASSDFITNANLDDRSRENSYEVHLNALKCNPQIDLVYSDYFVLEKPIYSFYDSSIRYVAEKPEFSLKDMRTCPPGPRPVWRKSLHKRFGYFDESITSSGDWEMWLRAVSLGAVYQKIPGVYTAYYLNPIGLSTDKKRMDQIKLETKTITQQYGYLWEK